MSCRTTSLDTVLTVMNAIFSVIFLADFLYRIVTAPSAGAYFFKHFGWADLLASVPFAQFKILRIFRLIRVYRLLREVGIRTIGRALIKDRAGSSLYILLLMGIFVLEFGSLTMLRVEQDAPGANITTASDAIWYTIVTISTVGYGDQYPVTDAGRIIGSGIIVLGVGIFGTFTGYLANFFLAPKKKDPAPPVDAADTVPRRSKDSACASKSPKPSSPRSESCSSSQPSERPCPAFGTWATSRATSCRRESRRREAVQTGAFANSPHGTRLGRTRRPPARRRARPVGVQ